MKKVLLFVGVVILVLAVTLTLPICMYNKYNNTYYFTEVENENGVMIPNTMYLISKIANELDNKEYISTLSKEFQNINVGRTKDAMNLFLCMGIVVVISIIVSAIILIKNNSKLIGSAFITSGIISGIVYALMYYMVIMNIINL